MSGVGEGEELGVRAVAQAFVRHFGQKEGVTRAPEDAGGDAHSFVWEFDASAEQGAVPVDHTGERAGLRPCSSVFGEISGGESAWAARAEKRLRANAEVERGEDGFREPGKLKEKHVQTAE